MSWFMKTDKFGFKVFVKDGPRTRHGILFDIHSLYDLRGMTAPFILP